MTHDNRERERWLESVIASFLETESRGEDVDRERLIAEHPALANSLQEFFANHDRMKLAYGSDGPSMPMGSGAVGGEDPTLAPSGTVGDEPTLDADSQRSRGKIPGSGDCVRYFGDYELLEEIARGGMGVVFKARQINLNRTVALKMILAGQFAGHQDVQRFYIEAEAAAQLDHPGIVPIFEIGEHDGQHYFSMGYVEGQSLAQRVANGPIAPHEAAELVKQICNAVSYAHEHGVIHRDLKPANILLDRNGQPKVTDFGLAKRVESDSDLTGTGQILGTPAYMPPEQASGKIDQVGPLADVYSLGAILYCLLTGRPPFQAASPMDTLLQVIDRDPIAPSTLNLKVPLDLDTICLKCMNKEPLNRYQGAGELQADLQRFLAGEPIKARPVGKLERALRWCSRNPVTAKLIAATSLALIVGTCISLSFAYIANQRAIVVVTESRRADENSREAKSQERLAKFRAEEARLSLQQAKQSERSADAERLSLLSQQAMRDNRPQRAMLLAAEAVASTTRHGEPATLSARQNLQDVLRGVTGFPIAEQQAFRSIQISPRYRWIAGISNNATVMLYPSEAFYRPHTVPVPIEPPCENVTAVAVGDQLLAIGTEAGQIHVYRYMNANSAKRIATFHAGEHPIIRLILGNSQNYLLASTASQQLICWRLEDQQQVVSRIQRLDVAKFSADDRWLFTASNDPGNYSYIALLHDLSKDDANQPHRLDAYTNAFHEAVFSADSKELVTSNGDGKLRLWDLEAKAPADAVTMIPTDFGQSPYGVHLSGDNRWMSSVDSNKALKLWDLQKVRDAKSANRRIEHAKDVSVSLNVRCEIGLSRGSGGVATYQPISFSPDSKWLSAGGLNGDLYLWEMDSIKIESEAIIPRQTLSGHKSAVTAIQWELNNRMLATGSSDHTVRIWNHEAASQSWVSTSSRGHDSTVDKICIADGMGPIITHDEDGDVRKWNGGVVASEHAGGELLMSSSFRACAHFSASSQKLLIRTNDMFGSVYRLETRSAAHRLKTFRGHELGNDHNLVDLANVMRRQRVMQPLATVAPQLFGESRDGRWLATSAGSSRYVARELIGKVRVWDMMTDDPGADEELYAPFETPVTALAISQSGRWLAIGSENGLVTLYDRTDPQRSIAQKLQIPKGKSPVVHIALTESQPWLMCQSADGVVAIWRLDPMAEKGIVLNAELQPDVFDTQSQGDISMANRERFRGLCVVGSTEQWLATLHDNSSRVSFFDLRDESPVQSMQDFELPWVGPDARSTLSEDHRWLVVVAPQETDLVNVCIFDMTADRPIESRLELMIPGAIDVYVSDDHRWLIATTVSSIAMFPMTNATASERLSAKIEFPTPSYATDISFHGPTQRLAAAFREYPIHVWELDNPSANQGPVHLDEPANEIHFIDEGKSLLSFANVQGDLRSVRISYLDSERLTKAALGVANRNLSESERIAARLGDDQSSTTTPPLPTNQQEASSNHQAQSNSENEVVRTLKTIDGAANNDSSNVSDRSPLPDDIEISLAEASGFAADSGAFALSLQESLFGVLSESLKDQGYEIRSLRPHLMDGERRFAVAWARSSDQAEYRLGVSKDEIVSVHQELIKKGYRALDLGGYFESPSPDALERFYGVWRKTGSADVGLHPAQNIAVALSENDIEKRFQKMKLTHRPLTRQVYFTPLNEVRFCEIWEQTADIKKWAVGSGSPQSIEQRIKQRIGVPQKYIDLQYIDIATTFDGTESVMTAVWRDRPSFIGIHPVPLQTMSHVARELLIQGYVPKSLSLSNTDGKQWGASVWTFSPAEQK